MAVEVGSAYISLQASTRDLDKSIKTGLDASVKHADAAGKKMGDKLVGSLGQHMDKGGGKVGDAFGKTFTPKVQGAGKNAMQGLAQAMLGGAEGIGSQVGGKFSGGLVSAITRGADGAVAALGKLGTSGGWSQGMVAAGTVAAGGVALVSAAAVAAGIELYKLGSEWDGIADGITFKTGLIGDALEAVKDSVKNVAADTAASIGDIANVSAALVKGLRIPPGEGLETLTKQISEYNAAAQENGAEPLNIREFIKAMKQMNMDGDVPAMSKMLDDMYKVTQNTTIPMNDLLTQLKLLGPAAEQFNIPVSGLIQLMAALDASGVDSKNALLGLKTAWSKLGDDPSPANALRAKIEEIKTLLNSTSEDAQTAGEKMATEFFGNKAGPQLAQAIRDGNVELDNFNTKAAETGLTIGEMTDATSDFSQEWTKFKNWLSSDLEPVASFVFGAINAQLQYWTQNVRDLVNLVNTLRGAPYGGENMTTGDALTAPGDPTLLGTPGGAGGGTVGGPRSPLDVIAPGLAGGLPAGVGGGGRGYMNYGRTSAYLDQITGMSDEAILARVPSGRYDNGAVSNLTQGLADCSSAVEDLVNIIDGRPTAGREMTTFNASSWLTQRGFRPGYMPGAMNVAFTNNGTPHMEATLPGGTNFNWGNNTDAARGGRTTSQGAASPQLEQKYYRYDEGGILPPGFTLVENATGQNELVLNPEQQKALEDQQKALTESGVDPNTLIHGLGAGAAPGPDQAAESPEMPPSFWDNLIRSQGFTPTGGGGVAGTSSIAQFIKMPQQFLGGLMDTAAQLGAMATSLAITAGAGGASGGAGAAAAAAGPALSYGFSLAAAEGKVLADYWLGDVPAIAADAMIAQMFPIGGPPRWLGYDYTQFAPNLGIQQAALTTMEQMGSKAINDYFNPQQAAHGGTGAAPGPQVPAVQANSGPSAPVGAALQPGQAPMPGVGMGPPPGPAPTPPPAAPEQPMIADPLQNLFGFDQGGYLEPGQLGINMTGRPEPVLTPQQWDSLASAPAGRDAPLVKIDAIYGMSPEDVASQIEQKQRLAAMRYSGRPYA